MSPFIAVSFWGFIPGIMNGFTIPKIAIIFAGIIVFVLRRHPRALLFLGIAAVSAWHGIYPELSLWGVPSQWSQGLLAMCAYLFIYAHGRTTTKDDSWLKWCGILLSIHAVAQHFGYDPLFGGNVIYGRASTWVGSPVDTGTILAMAAPVMGWTWLPLSICGVWATGSRGPLLAIAVAMLPVPPKWKLLFLPVMLLPLLSSAPKDLARVEMWKMAYNGFKESPWLGQGPSTFYVTMNRQRHTTKIDAIVGTSYIQTSAHNDLLEVLHSVGILGLLAYLILVIPLLRHPSLLALFVIVKFNPVSFEVLAAAALIASTYLKNKEEKPHVPDHSAWL